MAPQVKFSRCIPGADRIHYVNEEDVRIVLSRIPVELWQQLRAVHFNDRSRGARVLGYVNRERRDVALCALPPRVSLRGCGQPPEQFGAKRGQKWPTIAVRRFMLYYVLLHELGHLQPVDKHARSVRLKFAKEKLAHAFAVRWRKRLWAEPFVHPDPVHNPPAVEEFDGLSL